jgi:predicted enzyme related to lactoylglutathione lyase
MRDAGLVRLLASARRTKLPRMTDKDRGRFVWYELLTSDVKGAIDFYTKVIGWKTQKFDQGDYTMFVGSQGPLGGVTPLPEEAKKMGAGAYWQANVIVPDVIRATAEVKELGGKLYVSEDVPTVGSFSVIADPQGAVISIFTPASEMKPHDITKSGEFSWHELYTSDHEAAFRFYNKIAGWEKLGSFDMGPMGEYLLWGREGKQLGGMMTKPKDMKTPDGREVPNAWMYYITMQDFEAALERAKAAGATVLNGPMPVPGGQQIVQLMDPQGGAFALVTPPAS